ncbi:MAG: tetratricopeptide repeat protein, partial [Pirellulales bacterium]
MMLRLIQSLLLAAAISASTFADDKPEATAADAPAEATKPANKSQTAQELFEAGRKLFFQGDYKGAVEKLASAAAADPAKTSYKLLLSKAHRLSGASDKATAVLEAILKTNPDHVEAGVELAELLSPQKQPDRVIAVLEPLLKYKHDYPLYHL